MKPGYLFPFLFFSFLTVSCAQLKGSDSCPIGYKRAKAGNCVQDLSCEETQKCQESGKCTYAGDNLCVATRPSDCAGSSNCAKLGECDFRLNGKGQQNVGLCVANDAGCRNSEVCAQFGKCTPGDKGFCVVEDDDDCTESLVCKDQGRCTAKRVQRTDGRKSDVKSCQQ